MLKSLTHSPMIQQPNVVIPCAMTEKAPMKLSALPETFHAIFLGVTDG
jgi:hypothetical protein